MMHFHFAVGFRNHTLYEALPMRSNCSITASPALVVLSEIRILVSRFHCLLTALPQPPDTVVDVTMACVTLHNLMRTRYRAEHAALIDVETADHQLEAPPGRVIMNDDSSQPVIFGPESQHGKRVREYLKEYVSGPGAVVWQERNLQ
jgi:hypothetical protein